MHGALSRTDRAARLLTVGTLFGLIVATAAAFAITEKLKLEPSPILDTVVSKSFSPVCGCTTSTAEVSFRVRRGGRVGVEVVSVTDELVRRLAQRRFRAGTLSFRWFGRGQNGRTSADGRYKIRVHLFSQHRTIVFPNVIRLDTRAPKVGSIKVERSTAVVGERIRVDYKLGEVAHPILLVDGVSTVRGRFAYRAGRLDWFGRINGKPVRRGKHVLTIEARDDAGNTSTPRLFLTVRIRAHARVHASRSKTRKR